MIDARAIAALALAGVSCACSLAPRYQRPTTAPPPAGYQELDGWKIAAPADLAPKGPWWKIYQDPALDGLEAQMADANQSLKAALARLQEARAQTAINRAAYFPSLTADARATRIETSANSPNFFAGESNPLNDFIVGAELSYEIDLFGRVRNTVAGAKASEQATAGDVAALELSLQAELANDYFVLRGLDAQQELLDRTVADYTRALQLTENLYKGGAAAVADVQQAKAQLETAHTQAEDTRLRRCADRACDRGARGATGIRLPSGHAPARARRGAAGHRSGIAIAASGAPSGCGGRRTARRRGERQYRRRPRGVFSGVQPRRDAGAREHGGIQLDAGAQPLLVRGAAGPPDSLRCRAAPRAERRRPRGLR